MKEHLEHGLEREQCRTALRRRQDEILTATTAALSGLSRRAIEALAEALDVLAAQAGANVADFVTLNDEGWKLGECKR